MVVRRMGPSQVGPVGSSYRPMPRLKLKGRLLMRFDYDELPVVVLVLDEVMDHLYDLAAEGTLDDDELTTVMRPIWNLRRRVIETLHEGKQNHAEPPV